MVDCKNEKMHFKVFWFRESYVGIMQRKADKVSLLKKAIMQLYSGGIKRAKVATV